MQEKNSDASFNVSSSHIASPNKNGNLNLSYEEVRVRKYASNMSIPV